MNREDHIYYLENNLIEYAGEWVLIKNQKVIAHSKDAEDILLALSDLPFEERPCIKYVPKEIT